MVAHLQSRDEINVKLLPTNSATPPNTASALPTSPRTWLIDLPPWVTDVPSTGHHNGRVMREWWDLPTASSTRPLACEVRCQREAGCCPGDEASGVWEGRRWRDVEVFNQAASQDSDFIPDGTGMKNQNNKSQINRRCPRAIRAPRRWEEDGTERCELLPSPNKGLLRTVSFL